MSSVLVSRAMAPNHPWRTALETAGYQVVGLAFIRTIPLPFQVPDTDFEAVIFNSPFGVDVFLSQASLPPRAVVFAAGIGTQAALLAHGIEANGVGEGSDMERVAAQFAALLQGRRVLFPCSEQSEGTLVRLLDSALVMRLHTYKTEVVPHPGPLPEADVVVLTSGLNARGWFLSPNKKLPARVLAIGPSTAKVLTELSVNHVVCQTPDVPGILAQL